jgi:hypothetical protein
MLHLESCSRRFANDGGIYIYKQSIPGNTPLPNFSPRGQTELKNRSEKPCTRSVMNTIQFEKLVMNTVEKVRQGFAQVNKKQQNFPPEERFCNKCTQTADAVFKYLTGGKDSDQIAWDKAESIFNLTHDQPSCIAYISLVVTGGVGGSGHRFCILGALVDGMADGVFVIFQSNAATVRQVRCFLSGSLTTITLQALHHVYALGDESLLRMTGNDFKTWWGELQDAVVGQDAKKAGDLLGFKPFAVDSSESSIKVGMLDASVLA